MMKLSILFALCIIGLFAPQTNGQRGVAKDGLQKKSARHWFMYKGTKWCGPGHTAKNYNDLGKNRAVDKCCRYHDKHCSVRIHGYKKKYHTRNWSWKTRSACSCEMAFKKCLKKVNNAASRELFEIYFHTLEPKCIKLKTVKLKVCVKRRWGFCVKHKRILTKKAYFYNLHKALKI